MKLKTFLMAGAMSAVASVATAECAFENEVELRSLSAGFEAWNAVTDAWAECGNVQAELNQEFRTLQPQAFAADPSLYQIGGVSNGTITPLLNEGTIRPLDDLVEMYGQIRINGEIMAIAMMVNTQHVMYRSDIFEELGIEVPTTWDEVLEAAAVIQEAGVVDYPLGATMKTGWNLGEDFINMFLGYGGEFWNADGTPNVNSEAGMNALETMMAMTEFMDPEYLVSDSTYVQQQFQQGRIAMANLWASRGSAMDLEGESQVVGLVDAAAAPMAIEGAAPATTLWWDGVVIASNISDEDAEAAFRVVMEGLDREMVEANNDAAIWLIEGYEPGRLALGAIATASATPPPPAYPSTSQMGLMHTALGNELAAFFTGDASAEEALEAVEAAYTTAAQEAGVLE